MTASSTVGAPLGLSARNESGPSFAGTGTDQSSFVLTWGTHCACCTGFVYAPLPNPHSPCAKGPGVRVGCAGLAPNPVGIGKGCVGSGCGAPNPLYPASAPGECVGVMGNGSKSNSSDGDVCRRTEGTMGGLGGLVCWTTGGLGDGDLAFLGATGLYAFKKSAHHFLSLASVFGLTL